MQFNISFKTIFEYILKKLVLCIQIRFVSTEKTTRIASRASCFLVYMLFEYGVIFRDISYDIVSLLDKLCTMRNGSYKLDLANWITPDVSHCCVVMYY